MGRPRVLIIASLLFVFAAASLTLWERMTRRVPLIFYAPQSAALVVEIPRAFVTGYPYSVLESDAALDQLVREFKTQWIAAERSVGETVISIAYVAAQDDSKIAAHMLVQTRTSLSEDQSQRLSESSFLRQFFSSTEQIHAKHASRRVVAFSLGVERDASYFQNTDAQRKTSSIPGSNAANAWFAPRAHEIVESIALPEVVRPLVQALAANTSAINAAGVIQDRFFRLDVEGTNEELLKFSERLPITPPDSAEVFVFAPLSEVFLTETGTIFTDVIADGAIDALSTHYAVGHDSLRESIAPLSLFARNGDAWVFGGMSEAALDFARGLAGSYDIALSSARLPDGTVARELVRHAPEPKVSEIAGAPARIWSRPDLGDLIFVEGSVSWVSNSKSFLEPVLRGQAEVARSTQDSAALPVIQTSCGQSVRVSNISRLILVKEELKNKTILISEDKKDGNEAQYYCISI